MVISLSFVKLFALLNSLPDIMKSMIPELSEFMILFW
jgi:hypothetical protein